jgi:aquaporin Z
MTRKLVIEAIGTFFFVFTIGLVISANLVTPLAPLAIGSALMVMVFAGGHISGAHYNPAVTLAVFLRGKATSREMIGYWAVQLVAAAVAGALAKQFADAVPNPYVPDLLLALVAEFLFTFALAYVVLNVATTRGTEGNSYYGLAIGFTVMSGAFAAGRISGAVFNPAVGLGLVFLGASTVKAFAFYAVVQLVAGASAALLFRALDLGNDKATTATPAEQASLRPAAATRG